MTLDAQVESEGSAPPTPTTAMLLPEDGTVVEVELVVVLDLVVVVAGKVVVGANVVVGARVVVGLVVVGHGGIC
jgi:hypothetical protein